MKKRFNLLWTSLLFSNLSLAVEGGFSNYIPALYGDLFVALAPNQGWSASNEVYYFFTKGKRKQKQIVNDTLVDTSFYDDNYVVQNLTTLNYSFDKINDLVFVVGIQNTLTDSLNKFLSVNIFEIDRQSERETGFGDLAFVPFSVFGQTQQLYYSYVLSITAPLASYDKNKINNLGLNYWSFDNAIALTYLSKNQNVEISLGPGFIYNTKNQATNYHSGTEIHLEYIVNKKIIDKTYFGLQGYLMDQISKDKSDNILFDNIKTKARGIGPAIISNNIFNSNFNLSAK